MKKIAIVLGVVLASNISNAFYGSQLIQREYDQDPSQVSFLDAADNLKDEYGFLEADASQSNQINNQVSMNDQGAIDEYDQHVCDAAQPAPVSAAGAIIQEMFGFVLIQYIALREMTHAYCAEIKQTLNKWFTTLMKA
jgi:hypothetical protein